MRISAVWTVLAAALSSPLSGAAQALPSEPVRVFDGRLVLTGEAVGTAGEADHEGYFNYTGYERNALRMVRLSLAAQWQPVDRVALIAEVRSENFAEPGAYAAYVRVRPWRRRSLDIQAGRIPPVFGAFGRRSYTSDRLLVGYPLAYQYLTSLRPESAPATADDLLRMRARGWRASFPLGESSAGPGVPLISAFQWDTGVQARIHTERTEMALAVTTGTLSSPRVSDDNDGKQISARVAVRPVTGLSLGASAARGGWLSRTVPTLDAHRRYTQTAAGADAEYSRDHWLIRGEMVWSRWRLPFSAVPVEGPSVEALASWIEGRYRVSPRWYVAGRADRLGFSRVTSTIAGRPPTPWDAPVVRIETGFGYYLRRNVIARASLQWNDRDGGRVTTRRFLSGQVAYWF
ncbi:MAG: hypothetical protein ABIP65_10080 [Vicinamibacterales bacterium]